MIKHIFGTIEWGITDIEGMGMFFPECVARVPVSLWGSGG